MVESERDEAAKEASGWAAEGSEAGKEKPRLAAGEEARSRKRRKEDGIEQEIDKWIAALDVATAALL